MKRLPFVFALALAFISACAGPPVQCPIQQWRYIENPHDNMTTECPASATFNLADYGSVWIHTLGAIPGITTLSANLTSTCDDSAQLTYGIGMDQTTVAMANGPIYLSDMQTEDVYEYVIGVISETACTARFDDVEVTP